MLATGPLFLAGAAQVVATWVARFSVARCSWHRRRFWMSLPRLRYASIVEPLFAGGAAYWRALAVLPSAELCGVPCCIAQIARLRAGTETFPFRRPRASSLTEKAGVRPLPWRTVERSQSRSSVCRLPLPSGSSPRARLRPVGFRQTSCNGSFKLVGARTSPPLGRIGAERRRRRSGRSPRQPRLECARSTTNISSAASAVRRSGAHRVSTCQQAAASGPGGGPPTISSRRHTHRGCGSLLRFGATRPERRAACYIVKLDEIPSTSSEGRQLFARAAHLQPRFVEDSVRISLIESSAIPTKGRTLSRTPVNFETIIRTTFWRSLRTVRAARELLDGSRQPAHRATRLAPPYVSKARSDSAFGHA